MMTAQDANAQGFFQANGNPWPEDFNGVIRGTFQKGKKVGLPSIPPTPIKTDVQDLSSPTGVSQQLTTRTGKPIARISGAMAPPPAPVTTTTQSQKVVPTPTGVAVVPTTQTSTRKASAMTTPPALGMSKGAPPSQGIQNITIPGKAPQPDVQDQSAMEMIGQARQAIDRMKSMLEPVKDNDTPGFFSGSRIQYWRGKSDEWSPFISDAERFSVQNVAQLLKGSRNYQWINRILVHTPQLWGIPGVKGDSPKMVLGKLNMLSKTFDAMEKSVNDNMQKRATGGYINKPSSSMNAPEKGLNKPPATAQELLQSIGRQ